VFVNGSQVGADITDTTYTSGQPGFGGFFGTLDNWSASDVGEPAPVWEDISGATAQNYTTPTLTIDDDGSQYRFTDSNASGSVTSDVAALTVTAGGLVVTQSSRFDNAQTFYAGTVTATVTVNQSARFDNVPTFYAGTIAPTVGVTQSSRFDNGNTFYAGALTTTITVNQSTRFDNTSTFYGGVVTLSGGPQTIPQDSRFNNVNTFYGGAITTTLTVNQSARFDNAQTFYGGAVSQTSALQIVDQTARFNNNNIFYFGEVSGGAVVAVNDVMVPPLRRRRR
jgi:hypothetical protein